MVGPFDNHILMKNLYKYFSIITIISLFTCCATDIVDVTGNIGEFAGGSGTAYAPYLIKTAASMMRMKDYPDAHFALAADIDMEGYPWTPIPMETSFDGNNHTLYNLTISPYVTSDQIGLFSMISSAGVVKNLTLHNVSANFPKKNSVGALGGCLQQRASISNCHVVLTKVNSIVGADCVGGLIGEIIMNSEYGCAIANCSVSSTTSTPVIIGNSSVGGAIGYCDYSYGEAKISNLTVSACIAGCCIVGGVIGYTERTSLTQMSFAGTITGIYNSLANAFGGVAGASGFYTSYKECKTNVVFQLESSHTTNVGGIVGVITESSNKITASYSQGEVYGDFSPVNKQNKDDYAIGMVGYGSFYFELRDCYTLMNYSLLTKRGKNCYSIYDLVSEFSSPINIVEIMRVNGISDEYWDFNRTWTWKGTANGKTVTAICPKLKWEK